MQQFSAGIRHRFWRSVAILLISNKAASDPMPSSVIASYSYHQEEQVLRIVFVSGLVYLYRGVPSSIFESFKRSGSKGTYFNRFIKNHYPFERVTD